MLKKFIKPVYAHCDVPCGIYETDTMTHAAATVKRMMEKYAEIGEVDDEPSSEPLTAAEGTSEQREGQRSTTWEDPESMNTAIRCVITKEEHAQKCKDELYLLWSDYFKTEHLEKFPDLHDTFWQATKQCGKVKQSMDINEADKLVEMVRGVAHIFADSKK